MTKHGCDTQGAAAHMAHPLPDRALRSNVPRGIQPEPPFLWLFHWYFQPLRSPQAFHRFVIHLLACISQQGSDPAIAISTVLARQFDHVLDQALFVSTPLWQPTLRGSVLAQYTADTTLRNFELTAHMIDAGPPARGAQKFPDAASFKISLSSVRSETARRRRSFSFCSRFNSLSCSVPIPPYFFFQR